MNEAGVLASAQVVLDLQLPVHWLAGVSQRWDARPAKADAVAGMLPELMLARRQPVEPDEGQPAVG